MMESHVVISTPFDAAKRMSYLAGGRAAMSTCMLGRPSVAISVLERRGSDLAGGRAAMSTCMLGRSSVAISEGGGVRSLGRVGEDDALR